MVALFYLRWRKAGTEFSQETAASDSDDAHSAVIVIQISVSSTIRHRGITYGTSKAGQGDNQGWKGPGQSDDRIQSHRQSHQVLFWLLCSRKLYITCGER